MYQRIGQQAFKKDLTNTKKLLRTFGQPHLRFSSIHIAGTNGKGSVSHLLAAVFQAHGYSTGLYTSPHLLDFRERIRVNGIMIPECDVVALSDRMRDSLTDIQPSFFEMTVAMAFEYFAQCQVSMAIIETGLGGRLDSTNVITPVLSVITNIGLDHTEMLGDNIAAIAFEKAGIIKPDVPVVIGHATEESEPVFRQMANERRAPLRMSQDAWKVEILQSGDDGLLLNVSRLNKVIYQNLKVSLAGHYQVENVRTVLAALDQLERMGYDFEEEKIRYAFAHVSTLTGLLGRWQVLATFPRVIADTGHNAHGLKESMRQLQLEKASSLNFVLGLVKEKDWASLSELLPPNAHYFLTQADIPRAMPLEQLEALVNDKGWVFTNCGSVNEGVKTAVTNCPSDGIVFIGGSTFTVAEALPLFQEGRYVG